MGDERRWAPGKKTMLSRAMRDGVDPFDLAAVRAHAVHGGLAPDFVDEFLPAGPTWLGERGWLALDA